MRDYNLLARKRCHIPRLWMICRCKSLHIIIYRKQAWTPTIRKTVWNSWNIFYC